MKKLFGALLILGIVATFVGTLLFLHQKAQDEPVVYQTEAPYVTTIEHKTVATGSVVPRKEVEIKPQVSGIISEVVVEPGQIVRRGDLVARIRIIPDMVSQASAENRLNRARISLDDARRELERHQRLRVEGTIAESTYQDAQVAFEQAEEELGAARDHLDLIRKGSTSRTNQTSNTLVRATLSGMVLEVPVEQGDSVIETNNFNDGTTIATVADMDELIFRGKVDESEVGRLRSGMPLSLTIGAIEDERFEAELEHVAPKGIEENGAIKFEIRAALQLKDHVFVRANYSANADIVLDRRTDVLALDEALLQFDGDSAFVEVETAPQVFERRVLELGLSDGISIEVLSGVAEGERVKRPATAGASPRG